MDVSRYRAAETRPPLRSECGLIALVLLLLAGCSGDNESHTLLVDYQQQLASLLGIEPPKVQAPANIGTFPGKEQRLFTIPETRDSLFNVYALRACHITNLVAQRNNQLGRVAPASQRWLYELTLWRRLEACWNSDVAASLAESDRERLARLTETKTRQLPRATWNGLFGSEEWVKQFTRASSVLPPQETQPPEDQLEALAYLRDAVVHQFDPDWQPDSTTLEGHLKTLQERPFTAELLRTLLLAEQRMKEASSLLEDAQTEPAICQRIGPFTTALDASSEGERLSDWLGQLKDSARTWLGAIDELLEAQIEGPEAVKAYRRRWLSLDADGAPLPAFESALEHHESLRQDLDERCRENVGLNLRGESVLLVVQH